MLKEYCIVLSTFESEEQAEPILDEIVREGLGACIQMIPIKSKYLWKGEICCDTEVLVLIKTKNELYESLQEMLSAKHPYETPEIIKIDIAEGAQAYLSWISEVTRDAQ